MSLVLGYANTDSAIIMSDGRATRDGNIISENSNKTIKVNRNIILGFAGFKEDVEIFIPHIFRQMGEDRSEYFMDDFLEMMDFYMKDEEFQKNFKSSFIVIGRDNLQQMLTSIAGYLTNYEIWENVVTEPRILTIGGTIDEKLINNIFFKNIKDDGIPMTDRMRKTVVEVSKIDNSINENVFYSSI